jgi:hypothetical protein
MLSYAMRNTESHPSDGAFRHLTSRRKIVAFSFSQLPDWLVLPSCAPSRTRTEDPLIKSQLL